MAMIIYKTTNLINGKIYIGKACSIRVTKYSYLGSGMLLQKAIKKYGKGFFKRTTIDIAESREDQDKKEAFWIKFYDSRNLAVGYNIAPGGGGSCSGKNHYMYGKHPSKETRTRLSISRLGEKNHMHGRLHSAEAKTRMREALKGKTLSEEHRKKVSDSIKKLWATRRGE